MNTKIIFGLAILIFAIVSFARAADDVQPPTLPSGCENLQVPVGNEVYFRVFAFGMQIYRWNGESWAFVAPWANLFASENYRGKVGTHYGGPTWESNSGSKVVAARLTSCAPDSTAIPWLLLQTVSAEGPGIFSKTSYIQRVNTVGGLAPSFPGTAVGEEKRVPYTTEYYFYREAN